LLGRMEQRGEMMSVEPRSLISRISAREIDRHLRGIVACGPRPDGSEASQAAGRYLEEAFRRSGLEVHRFPMSYKVIDELRTALWTTHPPRESHPCEANLRSGLTPAGGLDAGLIYVGKAFVEDLEGRELRGKAVLAFEDIPFEGNTGDGIRGLGDRVRDCARAGAAALIFADYRADDLIMTWGLHPDLAPIPCVSVSYPTFCRLRHLAEAGRAAIHLEVSGVVRNGRCDVLTAGAEGHSERPLVILHGTHYETVPACPGANDNASSLAILLELARVLGSSCLGVDLLYFASSGEEGGCSGSSEYVAAHGEWLARRAIAAIAFDQVAGSEVCLSAHGSESLNKRMVEIAGSMGYMLRRDDDPALHLRTGLSDVKPFAELGIPSVYLGGWASDLFYHTRADTRDKCNPNSLKALADVIGFTVWELAAEAQSSRGR
jgi:carboxypeptidase Q